MNGCRSLRPLTTAVLALALASRAASAQTVTTEGSISAGQTTEEHASAAGTQVRVFGAAARSIHFYAEAAWGATSDDDVPAFASAYPYGDRLQIIEAYAEGTLPRKGVASLKLGRYRTPFGISSGSDQGYSGFLRAPLIRYDGYFALSNAFLEQGADVMIGVPRFTVEASLGVPGDVGSAQRPSGLDPVIRVQGYAGALVVGASYISTPPYQNPLFAHGRARFTGIDARWMRSGLQFRGEWLTGQPFDNTSTTGWYADVLVHRVGMGPVTVVGRAERLRYDTTPPFDMSATRQTAGARIRVVQGLSLQANLTHQTGGAAKYTSRALDVGLTYSLRTP